MDQAERLIVLGRAHPRFRFGSTARYSELSEVRTESCWQGAPPTKSLLVGGKPATQRVTASQRVCYGRLGGVGDGYRGESSTAVPPTATPAAGPAPPGGRALRVGPRRRGAPPRLPPPPLHRVPPRRSRRQRPPAPPPPRARAPLLTLRLVQAAAIVPSLPNHNRLLGLLCRAADLPPIPVLLAHRLHLRMRVAPNAASYAALLDGYARVPDPGAAQKRLDEMPQCGLVPSSLARSFLVKALLRARDVDAAMDVVHNHLWPTMAATDGHQLREDQVVTNAAFANLVQCLCAEGFFHVIFQIAEEMPQRRCHVPDEFAYAQMIDSLCRSGQHHGASRIVYIMRKRGLYPSPVSYNCIVHGLCTSPKPGACLRAHQLVMEGTSFGYRPREVTYKVLVDELCRENELAKAKDVLELMLQPTSQCRQDEGGDAGDETRTRIYNVFLGALHAVDNPSEQLGVLVSMLQSGCKPDVITMNTAIHGFCKSGGGGVQEARRILDDMLNGKFCTPDVVTFTILISGYLDAGDHAEALNVLHTLMPRRRCSPTVITYNCVLKGLFGLGQVDTAMQVLEEMNANNVAADSVTHTVVIKGLCDAGQLEKTKEFWDNVIWPSVCYNILIDAACKQGLKKLAYQLVKEMKINGLAPDAVTWRILGKLHHYEEDEQEEHQLPTADVGGSSADDRLEPLVLTKEMPLLPPLSSSVNICEVNRNNDSTDESDEDVGYSTGMANNNKAEAEEIGYSTKMTVEEPPGNTDPTRGTAIDKGDITWGDGLKKQDKQPLIREPLSRVAKRVFGIL
ncbi:pentatricopeptide repeat-containing protein [Panicum miliaceum]|uniref:Pentatricopeptide repeat-containing protein n=1 Tax=Panicum miliaceum TaxID=4540 RepID=A0A3L6QRL4_PANMI|nr:pentatricopeptide repeat-containing protein [Panicum miliaceum]